MIVVGLPKLMRTDLYLELLTAARKAGRRTVASPAVNRPPTLLGSSCRIYGSILAHFEEFCENIYIAYVQEVVTRPKILNRTFFSNRIYVTYKYFAL
mgnify:CR=1 FL=1